MNTPISYSALRFTPLGVVTMLTAILIVMGSHHPSAQTVTSDLRGTVTDATGAVLAGALVKAEGPTDPRERKLSMTLRHQGRSN